MGIIIAAWIMLTGSIFSLVRGITVLHTSERPGETVGFGEGKITPRILTLKRISWELAATVRSFLGFSSSRNRKCILWWRGAVRLVSNLSESFSDSFFTSAAQQMGGEAGQGGAEQMIFAFHGSRSSGFILWLILGKC